VKTGVHKYLISLDSRLRGNDGVRNTPPYIPSVEETFRDSPLERGRGCVGDRGKE